VHQLLAQANAFVWGPYMLALLVGTGIFLTAYCGFVQFRYLLPALRLVFRRDAGRGQGDISPLQALTTALSATIGTGNIAGVATAIALGGPGAIFWMWICALFGMATKYAEAVLAVTYRRQLPDGSLQGGPMCYLADGLGWRWLGALFAVFGALAAFGIGSMVQSNSVAVAIQGLFAGDATAQIDDGVGLATGLILALLTGVVIIGGIRRIGKVTEKLVPAMALFYILGALLILVWHSERIPDAFALIFAGAFSGSAASGGFAGATLTAAMRFGIARGIFSNEAGLGSAPIAHAAARTDNPVRQGLVAMTGVFFDTLVICTMTALVILVTGVWDSGLTSSALTQSAFASALDSVGIAIVTIGLTVFAYSTMIGWAYYGEECIGFLLGPRSRTPYRYLFCLAIFVGALQKVGLVWDFSDTMNGAMAIPNLIGLIGLSGVLARTTRDGLRQALGKG